MREGWMRPSEISFSSAMRAISRRTGLKVEMVMASGVSSMIRSTPVSVSIARMLRPSRPMMRPFISSFGRSTTETVASDTVVGGAALDGEGDDVFGLFVGCLFVLLFDSESFCAISWRASVFDPLQQGRARVLHGHTRDALQLVHLRLAELFDFFAQRIVVTYLFFERVLLFL